jgi:hypothetical protein
MRRSGWLQQGKYLAKRQLARMGLSLVTHRNPTQKPVLEFIYQIRSERQMLLHDHEAAQLYYAVQSVRRVPGDLAEVGCYRGASAKLIRRADPAKLLRLFDTFAGLPEPEIQDRGEFCAGAFDCSLEDVAAYLGPDDRISFHPGLFPKDTGKQVEECKFSFVHLDVDLYRSTLDSLEFFHPRLSRGAVLIVHDYLLSGVHQAVAEFSERLAETFIPLNGTQVLFVKG